MNSESQKRQPASHPNPASSAASAEGDSGSARAATSPATPADSAAIPSKPLTAEEQMALYEDDLKENDWGHQPC